jgi:isoleucyl-tRNA synthetase
MPFQDVPAKVDDFPTQELQVLQLWKDIRAFDTLRALHRGQPRWSFLDGPVTANNPLGVHHGWGRTYKDVMNRYWTMRGRELRYQNGFDCQGLWVEVEVEKSLGFRSKKDIEDYGLDQFVRKCKERVLRYAAVQTEQSIRLGYWMDWDDPDHLRHLANAIVEEPSQRLTVEGPMGPVTDTVEQIVGRLGMLELGGSYFTFSNENNYMIWSFLKKCWQQGWLYRGADVMPWCWRCATALSQHEIVTDGYQELTHSGVTLRFPLRGRERESLLVWTTTPWTLSSNVAAAVGPQLTYVKVRQGDEVLYLAEGTVHMLQGPYEVLAEMPGTALAGWAYDGPFDDLEAAQRPGGFYTLRERLSGATENAVAAHRVILWDEVSETEGTGIVHIAPGCGAEDFRLTKEHQLPIVAPLNDEGYFVAGFGWLTGRHVSEVAEPICTTLQQKGLLYHVAPYTHRYPTCWRCGVELIFRLVDEWFISMDELRHAIMDVTRQIRWIPAFGLDRELDWLRNMHDWMISKKRYWGLALPFWECAACGNYEVIGDERELETRAVEGWEAFQGHTPHRPYVDAIKIACSTCGAPMQRITDVANPWLDAGIVSFSTLGYRTDRDYWRAWYPADWISESFPGQFRNWFYSLLAMATVLDDSPPFRECFGYATLMAEDGRAMHKSWGNSIEFNEAASRMGVDVMRWLYCSHKPEHNLPFGYQRADEVRRQFLIPLWNVYHFFVTYANLDGWEPDHTGFVSANPEGPTPSSDNPLDAWILARLNQVTAHCTESLEQSDMHSVTLAMDAFLDDLSNWYIRRSRRRFWKSTHDLDKHTAYATLYHVLVKLCKLLAPLTPFVTEVMYQNLVRAVQPAAYDSMHHCNWPDADMVAINTTLLDQMALTRQVTSLGLGARSSVNLKVRQPLAKALVHVHEGQSALSDALTGIVADELNVKALQFVAEEERLLRFELLPNSKLLGPRFGAQFPRIRAALATVNPAAVVHQVQAGVPVALTVDHDQIELTPEEVLIRTHPAAGLAVATEKGVTVAVDTVITPELRQEGLARELVRRIQVMRKEAGFNIEDRITTYSLAEGALADAVTMWADYIKAETLSLDLVTAAPPPESYSETHTIEGMTVTLGVKRAAHG